MNTLDASFMAEHQNQKTRDGGPTASRPEAPPRGSAASRAFLRLLRVLALTGAGGRADLVYSSCVFTLITACCGASGFFLIQNVVIMLKQLSVIEVAALSGFFGLVNMMMWMPQVACFFKGRRRYGALLVRMQRCFGRFAALPRYQQSARKLCREITWLMAVAIALMLFSVAVALNFIVMSWGSTRVLSLTISNAGIMLNGCTFIVNSGSFQVIPLKFVFAGLQLISGFHFINTELQNAFECNIQLSPATLNQLMSLYDELSHMLNSLTKIMSAELISCITFGTFSNICMWLLLVISIHRGTLSQHALMIAQYVVGAGVTVVFPCEMTQRALTAVGDTRDLLLTAERRQPQLNQPLSLFRETVGRDLDRLGDLGLFRLQRSTLLSITATILTYIIVLVQFYGTPTAAVGCDVGNGTSHTSS